jgi:hypothetical protein
MGFKDIICGGPAALSANALESAQILFICNVLGEIMRHREVLGLPSQSRWDDQTSPVELVKVGFG